MRIGQELDGIERNTDGLGEIVGERSVRAYVEGR